jgi:hypothetical protein
VKISPSSSSMLVKTPTKSRLLCHSRFVRTKRENGTVCPQPVSLKYPESEHVPAGAFEEKKSRDFRGRFCDAVVYGGGTSDKEQTFMRRCDALWNGCRSSEICLK